MTSLITPRVNSVKVGIKEPVVAVSTENITLSGEQTVGGVAVVQGDRVLVAAQTINTENGIYVVAVNSWTRSTDFNAANDVTSGVLVTCPAVTDGFFQITFAGDYDPDDTPVAVTKYTGQGGTTANFASLQALTPVQDQPVIVNGHTDANDLGGGTFYGVVGTTPGTYSNNATGSEVIPTGGDGSTGFIRKKKRKKRYYELAWAGVPDDGVTDASSAIQAILTEAGERAEIYCNEPDTTYLAANLRPRFRQEIVGVGKNTETFTGNGTDPIWSLGDGTFENRNLYREIRMSDMQMYNAGGECLLVDGAPGWRFARLSLQTHDGTDKPTVDINFSWDGVFEDSTFQRTGDTFTEGTPCLRGHNNFNAVKLDKLYFGGTRALAMDISYCLGADITNSRIESMWGGMHFAHYSGSGAGNCQSIHANSNYMEQVTHPYRFGALGTRMVRNARIHNSVISNAQTTNITERSAMFDIHGADGLVIENNFLGCSLNDDEVIFRFNLYTEYPTKRPEDCVFEYSLYQGGTPAKVVELLPDGTHNSSMARNVGGKNWFKWMPYSSPHLREWMSPPITCSAGFGGHGNVYEWMHNQQLELGGRYVKIEIVEAFDRALMDGTLQLGDDLDVDRHVSQDLSALTYDDYGNAEVPIVNDPVAIYSPYEDRRNFISVVGGTSSATFRIRILYRVS